MLEEVAWTFHTVLPSISVIFSSFGALWLKLFEEELLLEAFSLSWRPLSRASYRSKSSLRS